MPDRAYRISAGRLRLLATRAFSAGLPARRIFA
jgi:hypothetical protein